MPLGRTTLAPRAAPPAGGRHRLAFEYRLDQSRSAFRADADALVRRTPVGRAALARIDVLRKAHGVVFEEANLNTRVIAGPLTGGGYRFATQGSRPAVLVDPSVMAMNAGVYRIPQRLLDEGVTPAAVAYAHTLHHEAGHAGQDHGVDTELVGMRLRWSDFATAEEYGVAMARLEALTEAAALDVLHSLDITVGTLLEGDYQAGLQQGGNRAAGVDAMTDAIISGREFSYLVPAFVTDWNLKSAAWQTQLDSFVDSSQAETPALDYALRYPISR